MDIFFTIDQAKSDLRIASATIESHHRYPCGLEHSWDDTIERSRCFFNSPDGQNGELYYLLRDLGWRHSKHEAEYHWSLTKNNMRVEYVEGDVYLLRIPLSTEKKEQA